VKVAQRLHLKNCLAAGDGNISVRFENKILITPSGVSKAFMNPQDMAELSLDGKLLKGTPSSEREMHLKVFQNSVKAKAVVHAHPPTAIAFSIAFPEMTYLPSDCISELILSVGEIPIVSYARPGTVEMGENLLPHLENHRVMILSRHGALAWGETLEEAYMGIERLEHSCLILKSAIEMGGLTSLPKTEVDALRELRKKLGPKTL
jgi:L-fuculose-phosphate aldolase